MADKPEQDVKPQKLGYSKSQLLGSAKYTPQQRDVLQAILVNGATYSHDQVKAEIAKFMRKAAD